jgi:hypothetical protein
MTYQELYELTLGARSDLPVRVRLGNGQVRDVAGVAFDEEFEDVPGEVDADGAPLRNHRITALILTTE